MRGSRAVTRDRRPPVTREAFRAAGREAAARTVRRAPDPVVRVILLAGLSLVLVLVASRLAAAVAGGARVIVDDVGAALPRAAEPGTLVLPAVAPGAASAEPIFDDLPAYTAQPKLTLYGRVPAFAVEVGRKVDLSLNGQPLGGFALDANGRFGAEVTLRDGANAIVARLLSAQGDPVATASATVVLDRAAPPLTLARPKSGEALAGPQILVEGKTAPRVSVRVNDRIVAVNPDGTFGDTVPAQSGPLTVVVVARNEAGVETTIRVPVMVRPSASAAPLSQISVSLDRPAAKPGESVNAQVVVTRGGGPAAGVPVTLAVGVVEVATARTDGSGRATIAFSAPTTEGAIAVVAITPEGTGRASLTVAR